MWRESLLRSSKFKMKKALSLQEIRQISFLF
jgi:hypothetical protein